MYARGIWTVELSIIAHRGGIVSRSSFINKLKKKTVHNFWFRPRYSTHYVNTAFNKGFGGIRYDKMDFIRTVI